MWNGKKKAVTFSFDDGVVQDRRAVALLNKYGLKGTFNLNSNYLGQGGLTTWLKKVVSHSKVEASEVKDLYKGHEVAVHTLTHPHLEEIEDEGEIVRQVEEDRKKLSELCGYEVVGMAYPYGTYNDKVVKCILEKTGVKYSRTVKSTYDFTPQKEDLLRFHPTVYYVEKCLEEVVDKFLATETDEPQLLYIWGHTYELDAELITWEAFERVCQKLANRDDIFYGTNKEVLL